MRGASAPIEKVVKRDCRVVDLDVGKISAAIWKALAATGKDDRALAERLTSRVVEKLEERFAGKVSRVREIQDVVEETLVESGLYEVAKAYILYGKKPPSSRGRPCPSELIDRADIVSMIAEGDLHEGRDNALSACSG